MQEGQGTVSLMASTAALDRIGQRLLLPGNAFRATRLAVRNCKDGIDGEQEIGVHGKDHEDFTRSSKRRVHPKDRKKLLQADGCSNGTRDLRLCCTRDCLSDARAAARGSAAENRFPSD